MSNLEKMVDIVWQAGLKDDVDPSHESYFKKTLESELNKALLNALEIYQKDVLDKIEKRK